MAIDIIFILSFKLFDELEKAGALERKRQGLGKPNKLYLILSGNEMTSLWMGYDGFG